jgi:hypothetical protein
LASGKMVSIENVTVINIVVAELMDMPDSDLPTISEARARHWKCSKCAETFANFRELRDHMNDTHSY